MKRSAFFSDDFFNLFVRREWKVVLGSKLSNLWLLVAMLTATFLAISFSNASLRYLSYKMNDPFIKWVDIKNTFSEGDFSGLQAALDDPENQEKFDFDGYQSDYYFSYLFFGQEKNSLQYFQCRFFEDIKTPLVEAILDKDNVVDGTRIADLSSLSDETIGIIITKNALTRLGYDKAPAYIDICEYSPGADSLGVELYDSQFARIPLPVLAVVKRLPSNVDIISTKYFFEQECNDNSYPFNFGINTSYSESLRYFVPENVDLNAFMDDVSSAIAQSSVPATVDESSFYKPEIIPYVPGAFISAVGEDGQPLQPLEAVSMDKEIISKWADKGVRRVYDYNFSPYELTEQSFISVNFNRLNHVKEFEDFVGEYKVKLDMSQINSKDNYNAVSIMGNILSWVIIVFAIVCIILFIVDLLKSYFQKVKKNIGTFKAFGVSNRRLISIYVLIVGVTIAIAVAIALLITFILQEICLVSGFVREGAYNYLALGSPKTVISVFIVIIASICTIYFVMEGLLKKTPGDLIYDR